MKFAKPSYSTESTYSTESVGASSGHAEKSLKVARRILIGAGAAFALLLVSTTSAQVNAQDMSSSGPSLMQDDRTIVENIASSPDHTTLAQAIHVAELEGMLSDPGMMTMFAPTDAAFATISATELAALMAPENKARLRETLLCHVFNEKASVEKIAMWINQGSDGMFYIETLGDCQVIAELDTDGMLWIQGPLGNRAQILKADIEQANGMIHVVDNVMMPVEDPLSPPIGTAGTDPLPDPTDPIGPATDPDNEQVDVR